MEEGRHSSRHRATVPRAADALGTMEGALRKRIARGTIPHERDGEGRVWVLLDDRVDDREDAGQDARHDAGDPRALVDAYRERVEDLKEQLAAEREANRENRRIIAGLTQRIPELTSAPDRAPDERDRTGAQETPGGQERVPGGVDNGQDRPGRREDARKPWWRRVFGG